MKTEDKLDRLFQFLRSETPNVENRQIHVWLSTVSIGTGVTSFSLMAKLKAFLKTTFGKICAGIIISTVLVNTLSIFSSESTKVKRDTHLPRTIDQGDTILMLSHQVPNNSNMLSSALKSSSSGSKLNADSIISSFVEFFPLHLIDMENLEPTVHVSLSQSKKDEIIWAGVYKTFEDFLSRHFYDSIPINVMKNKIYVGSFDRVVLKTAERKTSFKLGTIYGFYDGENLHRYRQTKSSWEDYGYFTVRETDGLVLYSQAQTGYKGTNQTRFYYSTDLNSPIKSLSIKNLLADFQSPLFIEQVKKPVDRLTNMSQGKWSRSLKEINEVYRAYFIR